MKRDRYIGRWEHPDNLDNTWWPIFWTKRFQKYLDDGSIPKGGKVLDFNSVNYPNTNPFNMDITSYDHPMEGEFDPKLQLYDDNSFDAIVFHSSINKDPRLRIGHPGLPSGKAWSFIGTNWALKPECIARWGEYYRISKDKAVWFITCLRHYTEHHVRVEKWLTDEDRHHKTVIVEGW